MEMPVAYPQWVLQLILLNGFLLFLFSVCIYQGGRGLFFTLPLLLMVLSCTGAALLYQLRGVIILKIDRQHVQVGWNLFRWMYWRKRKTHTWQKTQRYSLPADDGPDYHKVDLLFPGPFRSIQFGRGLDDFEQNFLVRKLEEIRAELQE